MEYRFGYVLYVPGRGPVGQAEEQPLSTGGDNRAFNLPATNGALVLAPVFFGDLETSDVLS